MPKQFVVIAPKTIEFRDYEEPALKSHDVRIRTVVSGIKHGTELTLYSGQTPFLDKAFDPDLRLFIPRQDRSFFPINLGHGQLAKLLKWENKSRDSRLATGSMVVCRIAPPMLPTRTSSICSLTR